MSGEGRPHGCLGAIVMLASFGLLVGSLLLLTGRVETRCRLCALIDDGDVDGMRRELATGVDVNRKVHSLDGTRLPFRLALEKLEGRDLQRSRGAAAKAIVLLMLDAGANPNADIGRRRTVYAAEAAASDADVDIMRAMVAHGLDPKGRVAWEALGGAAAACNAPVLQFLLQSGVDPNYSGWGPKLLARAKDPRCLATLRAAGAKDQ